MTDPLLERYLAQVAAGGPVTLSPDELSQLRSRYPFFSQPAASALEAGAKLSPEEADMLRRELSLNSADLRDVETLLRHIAGTPDFYPPADDSPRMTTESTIDTFLERYGNPADNDRELSTLEKLIFNPVAPDYLSTLADDAQPSEHSEPQPSEHSEPQPASPSSHDRLIDAFLSAHADSPADNSPIESPAQAVAEAAPPRPVAPSEQPDRHALLSESLAKIFIRRGRYEKAFEIIHSLSLNYPEKSVYFADQLRFLQKAILISKRREAAQHIDNHR